SWSQPMPVLRSAMAWARASSSAKAARRASMTTKSLPSPCILMKSVALMARLIWRAAAACPMDWLGGSERCPAGRDPAGQGWGNHRQRTAALFRWRRALLTADCGEIAPALNSGGAGDPLADQLGTLVRPDPAHDRDPFALFQVLVMLKEMGDLIAQDDGQVLIGAHPRVIGVEGIDRDGDDLLVGPRLVLHEEQADRPRADDGAGNHRRAADDEDVAGIAVAGEGMRDEAVIARIEHRGMEEAVDHEGARFLVELVFDRLAALR